MAQDRPEWLINFVRQYRGELSDHRDAAYLRDLLPQEMRFLLGLLALRDVERYPASDDRVHDEQVHIPLSRSC
jgi:hypothetical protein